MHFEEPRAPGNAHRRAAISRAVHCLEGALHTVSEDARSRAELDHLMMALARTFARQARDQGAPPQRMLALLKRCLADVAPRPDDVEWSLDGVVTAAIDEFYRRR